MVPRKSTKTSKKSDKSTKSPSLESTSKPSNGDWRKRFLIPLIIVLLAGLAYVGLQQLIAATVNGTPISRLTLIKEMETQIGEQVLDSLITKQLILQEGKKQGIEISDEEIEEEIASLKKQFEGNGQSFEDILAMQGVTIDRVKKEIRMQLIVEKIVGQDVKITEEEIDQFIEQNSSFLPEDQDTTDPLFREDIQKQLKQQKVGTAMQSWIEELKSEANIKYYGPFATKPSPEPESLDIQEVSDEVEVPPSEE